MSFNENLKEAMYVKNCITKELARKTGINADTISSYLKTNGSIPTADKAVRLAEALDVTVEFLVTGFNGAKTAPAQEQPVRTEPPAHPMIQEISRNLRKFSKSDLLAVFAVVQAIEGKYSPGLPAP